MAKPELHSDSTAKTAQTRLEKIRAHLNLSPSVLTRQTTKDMALERAAADFNIESLACFHAGNKEMRLLRKQAYKLIENDAQMSVHAPANILEFTRDEIRDFTMGQIKRVAQLRDQGTGRSLMDHVIQGASVYSESFCTRYFVHDSLFRNTINMLGTSEQAAIWIDDIDNYRISGCFAMTELGHSSSQKELETEAVFEVSNDEFYITTTSMTGTKWFIGGAAHTATHAVVLAQTVVHGRNVGLNWFVVQLREKGSGQVLPAITIGDTGGKAGHQGLDTGWIQFKNVKVPRSQMLAKWSNVDRQGNYTAAPNAAIVYATLIPERLSKLNMVLVSIPKALTIATRYGVMRRQGDKNQQIMDYQSHYVKLIPPIAFVHMLRLVQDDIDFKMKVTTPDGIIKDPQVYLEHMGEMHLLSASIKVLTGWFSADTLEVVRRSAGGHAFSLYSSIPGIIGSWGVMTTGGGDNQVLADHAARSLLHCLDQKLKNDVFPSLKFKSCCHYIEDAKRYLGISHLSMDIDNLNMQPDSLGLIEEALNAILVKRLYSINQKLAQGFSRNDVLLECTRIVMMHSATYVFSVNAALFGNAQPIQSRQQAAKESVQSIMGRLTKLWGIHILYTYNDQGILENFLSPQQVKDLEKLYLLLNKELRYQMIGLTDAFGLPDFVIKTPLGRYDGNIYNSYFETVLLAPKSVGIPVYHDKHIRPLTERK